jgi:hypothetical protein
MAVIKPAMKIPNLPSLLGDRKLSVGRIDM